MFFIAEVAKDYQIGGNSNYAGRHTLIVEADNEQEAKTKVGDRLGTSWDRFAAHELSKADAVWKNHVLCNVHYFADRDIFNFTVSSKPQPVVGCLKTGRYGGYQWFHTVRGVGAAVNGIQRSKHTWGAIAFGITQQAKLACYQTPHKDRNHWHWVVACAIPDGVRDWKAYAVRYCLGLVKPDIEAKVRQLTTFVEHFEAYERITSC